ncbi:MAG: hypothetical protein ACI8RD_013712, partial [Bacillariaceae sp.]
LFIYLFVCLFGVAIIGVERTMYRKKEMCRSMMPSAVYFPYFEQKYSRIILVHCECMINDIVESRENKKSFSP